MILKYLKNSIIAMFVFLGANAYADSIYVEEPNNNSKMDVDFNLKFNVDIFQFHGENLTSKQEYINKELISFVNKNCEDYKIRFECFIEDVTNGHYTSWGFKNELEIWCEVHSNNKDLLSLMVYARKTGGGGNGCRTSVKAFNFLLGENARYSYNLNLSSILKDDESYLGLLKEVNLELAKRESPLVASLRNLVKDSEFAFAKDGIVICFGAYTVGCGADCIVEVKIEYSRIENLLKH